MFFSVFVMLFSTAETIETETRESKVPSLHTVFSTECNAYFDWQSLGLLYSFRKVKQKGGFTRLMACNKSPPPGVHVVPDTHVHPNYAVHPRTKDAYSPYNKPFSIMHWIEHAKPTADYIIVLDADMVFRKAITAAMLGVAKGRPISAHYGYLVGVFKQNYMKVKERVPNVEKAQQVGGFTVMHREDLQKVAPRWLYWTEEVRQDPESWGNTGDIFNSNGKSGPPWISEMYGYVFACAEVGVKFKVSNEVMLYPGYQPPPEPWPAVMHYGITYNVDDYAFDKHWYMGSDFTSCPGRIFNKPMLPENLIGQPGTAEHRRKTVALTVAQNLYEATKWWSGHYCNKTLPDPPKESFSCNTLSNGVISCRQISDETARSELLDKLRGAARDQKEECKETNTNCCSWASKGECKANPGFMLESCQRSCNLCHAKCQEGCCPPSNLSQEEVTDETTSDEKEADVNVNSPLEVDRSPPNTKHGNGNTWSDEHTEVQNSAWANTNTNRAQIENISEDADEEDYDDQDSGVGMLNSIFHWKLLLAFGCGSICTLLLTRKPHGNRIWRMRAREKTEKGSQ